MSVRAFAVAFALAAATIPALGDECQPSTASPEVDTAPLAARHYVDADCWQPGCQDVVHVWIYEESNAIDGLQRRDDIVDNTCGGQIESDTLVF